MNKTKIEWADYTWNPVTGCLHGCPYCYARGIANRFGKCKGLAHKMDKEFAEAFDEPMPAHWHELDAPVNYGGLDPYPYGFEPTLHGYRLCEPASKTKGTKIFVCSMADLFGEWVPKEWIDMVFTACEAAPQHKYLFLTKNPRRYLELYEGKAFPYADNYWFGTTCTMPGDDFVWMKDVPYHCFVSIEPLLTGGWGSPGPERWPEWVIIGAETGNRRDKTVPEPYWIEDIVAGCSAAGVPVYMKESLVPIVGESNMLRQWPASMGVVANG